MSFSVGLVAVIVWHHFPAIFAGQSFFWTVSFSEGEKYYYIYCYDQEIAMKKNKKKKLITCALQAPGYQDTPHHKDHTSAQSWIALAF